MISIWTSVGLCICGKFVFVITLEEKIRFDNDNEVFYIIFMQLERNSSYRSSAFNKGKLNFDIITWINIIFMYV